jgi:hypothetical protein
MGGGNPQVVWTSLRNSGKITDIGRRFRVARGRRQLSWGVGVIVFLAMSSSAAAAPDSSMQRLAYLDPGTGSMILQALIATLAGTAVAVSAYWKRIKAFFSRSPVDAEVADESSRDD